MKTTVKELDYEKVMALPQYPHLHPIKPGILWRTLIRGLSALGLAGTRKTVLKGRWPFRTRGLQSAARTPWPPGAVNSHTCSLQGILRQVHAPAENDLILFAACGRLSSARLF